MEAVSCHSPSTAHNCVKQQFLCVASPPPVLLCLEGEEFLCLLATTGPDAGAASFLSQHRSCLLNLSLAEWGTSLTLWEKKQRLISNTYKNPQESTNHLLIPPKVVMFKRLKIPKSTHGWVHSSSYLCRRGLPYLAAVGGEVLWSLLSQHRGVVRGVRREWVGEWRSTPIEAKWGGWDGGLWRGDWERRQHLTCK